MKKLQRRMSKFKGLSVGLDLHKKFVQVSVLDEEGEEIQAERIDWSAGALTALMDDLLALGRPLRVAMEASGCFLWVYDLLVSKLGQSCVRVAAPSKVEVIAHAGEKTDATDAWWLAYLLQEGRLPESFVAQGDLRELRIASRERRRVTQERSDLKRRLRSHFAQLGVTFASSAWSSVSGRAHIASLVASASASGDMRGEAIARLWSRVEDLRGETSYWDERVDALSVPFEEVSLLDDHLPGVGRLLAAIIWSELGDPRRYHSSKAYAKATGLTPGFRESGGRRRNLGITRAGSGHVRWAFTRAVVSCLRCKEGPGLQVKRWLLALTRRKSKKAAIVAAARKLAEATWRLFALGEALDLRRAFPA